MNDMPCTQDAFVYCAPSFGGHKEKKDGGEEKRKMSGERHREINVGGFGMEGEEAERKDRER